jgi:murein DD-endopeptidase MepM/ murein hydrolase activator NlpD
VPRTGLKPGSSIVIKSSFFVFFLLLTPILAGNSYEGSISGTGKHSGRIWFKTSCALDSSHRGDKAIDCRTETSWISSGKNSSKWIEIDFGEKRLVTRLLLRPGVPPDGRNPSMSYCMLQFYLNGRWVDFRMIETARKNISGEYKPVQNINIDLGSADFRLFRIYIPQDAVLGGYASISEIELFLGDSRITAFDERFKGWVLPISGCRPPSEDQQYPNARREYRNGTHKGFDIYSFLDRATGTMRPLTVNTPVLSVADGIVIRSDTGYKRMDQAEWEIETRLAQTYPPTYVVRSFGGRQVWIDHGNGIITAYNHLSRIKDGLKLGSNVKKGEKIGYAGNSGLSGEAKGTDEGIHLHFEIWIDGQFFGYGMKLNDIKRYFRWIFFPED